MKSDKRGFQRLLAATKYSKEGILSAWTTEEAFRQEMILYCILLPVIFLIPTSINLKILLFFANSIVIITELLNSAIESIVDLVSPDYNIFAKRAKDMGSAAVLFSLVISVVTWSGVILSMLQ